MEDTNKGAGHPSGVHSTQKECRESLPPVNNDVPAAKDAPGTTTRIAKKQTERGVN
jgi:hypothetical protein